MLIASESSSKLCPKRLELLKQPTAYFQWIKLPTAHLNDFLEYDIK